MLHIFLLILKILGIIILAILGLLILMVLACLFVPVLYRIKADKHESNMSGKGKVIWLFLSVAALIDNKDKEIKVKIKLFGIPLGAFQAIGRFFGKIFSVFKRKDKTVVSKSSQKISKQLKVADDEKEDIVDKSNKAVNEMTKAVDDGKKEDDIYKEGLDKDDITEKIETNIEELKINDTKDESEDTKDESEDTKDESEDTKDESESGRRKDKVGIWTRVKAFLIKIWYFPKWLYMRIQKICLTSKELCGKIKRWKDFFAGDTFKRASRYVLSKGNALRKHIMPRKITGNITYGFDDPALTGQTLAIASIITPLYKGKFKVVPIFEQKILEGNIYIKGHVLGFTLLCIAWSVYRNKDVKAVIKEFSKKEA